ncbi:MAG: translation initiation factor IF-3, partial [Anaeroplasmataceae bacterium]|nr:translation initiation factor IF-3 [Anaeroplasmataceae bacterium]
MLVITDKGEKLGVLPRAKALAEAEESGLDLVLVSPDSNPPVAKLMDYSR